MTRTTGTQLTFLMLFAAGICLQGCAIVQSDPFPDTTIPISIKIEDKLEHIPAIKRVDAVIEFGDGDKEVPSGIAYAPMGRVVLLGSSQLSAANKDLLREKERLTVDLKKMAGEALRKELPASGSRFSIGEDPEKCLVLVTPGVYLGFTNKEKARLWVGLTRWTTPDSELEGWDGSYIIGVGEPRPIRGRQGWISQDRKTLTEAVAAGLQLAFRTMLDDLNGDLRNEEAPTMTMTFPWLWDSEPTPTEVQVLKITKDGTMVRKSNGWSSGWTKHGSIFILPRDFPVLPAQGPKEPSKEDPSGL